MYTHRCTLVAAGDRVMVTGRCVVTNKLYTVVVSGDGLHRYHNGALAQDAFPELSKEDREFLVSGTSPEGWRELFGEG